MEHIVSGLVISTDIQSGTSKAGREWRKLVFVVEFTEGITPKHLALEMFGDERITNNPVTKGDLVTVAYDVGSTEWNGRWFTTASAYRVRPFDPSATPEIPQPTPQPEPMEVMATANVLADDSALPF